MIIKFLISLFIVFVLLLDYAALDDITTNKQESYVLEYAILVVSIGIFVLAFLFFRKNYRSSGFPKRK